MRPDRRFRASAEVRRLAGAHPAVLAECFGRSGSRPVPTEDEWRAALPTLVGHRLAAVALGLAPEVVRGIPRDAAEELRQASFAQVARREALQHRVLPVLERLTAAGVDFLVVKGPAVARYHARPADRTYGDIDVLVPPSSFDRVRRLAEQEGYFMDPKASQPWPAFDRLCREGVNLSDGRGGALDLHHRLPPWCFGTRLSMEVLQSRSEPMQIGPLRVLTPAAPDAAVIAALAACNDLYKLEPALLAWRDFSAIVAREGADRVRDAFAHAGVEWLFEVAVVTVGHLAEPGSDPVSSTPVPAAAARRLLALGWEGPTVLARHPVGWAARLPAHRAVAFVAGSLVPSRSYARDKHGGYAKYWAECVSTIRASVSGTDFRTTPLHQARDGFPADVSDRDSTTTPRSIQRVR